MNNSKSNENISYLNYRTSATGVKLHGGSLLSTAFSNIIKDRTYSMDLKTGLVQEVHGKMKSN